MTLIKSISGIRGTIGGSPGTNLSPIDIVENTAAFGSWLLQKRVPKKVVLGRDGRISGPMVSSLVAQTLVGMGIDVLDIGLSTTPTVEIAVPAESAGAGIICTASHNPMEWNALKFLNEKGEFISAVDGQALLDIITRGDLTFAPVLALGRYQTQTGYIQKHLDAILKYPLVKGDAIRSAKFKVVVDAINSTGALSVPHLLEALGCEVILINGEVNGRFAHNPEPLPQNLIDLSEAVVHEHAHLGIAVDPDVDRLALVCENGAMFGEEYTLVAVADYVLQNRKGAAVSNLSSTRALREVVEKRGGKYFASAVGEVNVVEEMKFRKAVIGGEGNGGVIVPDFHYGRDALIGIALFLSALAKFGKGMTAFRARFPNFKMVKDKISLEEGLDLDKVLKKLKKQFETEECNTIDGLKIDFDDRWVHLRKSNTEPIIRVYAEAPTAEEAIDLVRKMKQEVAALS